MVILFVCVYLLHEVCYSRHMTVLDASSIGYIIYIILLPLLLYYVNSYIFVVDVILFVFYAD